MFTCTTCQSKGNDTEMQKHLTATRHMKVQYDPIEDLIMCEECEDFNMNKLVLARFGLSDMALLCPDCLEKDEKPSTQYSLSNGSLLKMLEGYYRLRDLSCMECRSDKHLFVSRSGGNIVLCEACFKTKFPDLKDMVSETDDTFLTALLGIREHVEPRQKGKQFKRGRKTGRKGGKGRRKGNASISKKNDNNVAATVENKSHYHMAKAAAHAIKSGTTVAAVGTTKVGSSKAGSSKAGSSKAGSSKAGSTKAGSTKAGSTKAGSTKAGSTKAGSTKAGSTKAGSTKSSSLNQSKKSTSKSNNKSSIKPDSTSKTSSGNNTSKSETSKSGDKSSTGKNPKKELTNKVSENNSQNNTKSSRKQDTSSKKGISTEAASSKDSKLASQNPKSRDNKSKSKTQASKSQKGKDMNSDGSEPKHKKAEKKMDDSSKLPKNSGGKAITKESGKKTNKSEKPSKAKSSTTPTSSTPIEQKRENIKIPKEIVKYEPAKSPPLSFDSLPEYFAEMSYNLFLEEKSSNANKYAINSDEMTLEWYTDQDKKNKLFKVTMFLTEDLLNRLVNKKMQKFKKTPLSINQAVFLVLGDEIPWYGNVVTADTFRAPGRNKNLKMFEMVVELYNWNTNPLPKTVNVKWLKLIPASIPVSRVFLAMSRIDNPKFIDMILGKKPIKNIKFNNRLKFSNDHFNDSQKVAIQNVLNNSITVLQGPPGTGKTSTIYEIILQLIENLNTFPILVVAASNIAIDNIAEKLIGNHQKDILRIVGLEKEKEYGRDHPLGSICLHHKVYDGLPNNLRQTIQDMRDPRVNVSQNQFKKLLSEQIDLSEMYVAQAKVIFTTTVSAGGNQLKNISKLPVVIMDEATQSSEPTTLIPLSMPGVDKFIFVGDQKQLSSFSNVPNLSLSLFERVILNGTYKNTHMLDTQYRMHPAISDFPRKRFYNGTLKNGITEEDRKLSGIPENPVYFWDTIGKFPESRISVGWAEDRGFTYCNKGEIDSITTVLTKLIYEKGISRANIGVITPYRGQRDMISSSLVNNEVINPNKEELVEEVDRDDIYDTKPITIHSVADIMIASIDAFQGREKDFMIMSCVRSNKEHKIGFLRDERRLNVALTRARYGLIIIGDSQCLRNGDELWKEFMEDLESKKLIFQSAELIY